MNFYQSRDTFPTLLLPLLSFHAVWSLGLSQSIWSPLSPQMKPSKRLSIPPISLFSPFIFLCLVLLGTSLWYGSDGGQKAVVDIVGLLQDLETHIGTHMLVHLYAHAHTCTALFSAATITLQTIQPHWESFRLSLGPLRYHLSTHYPLSCWLNNTERKEERGTERKGGKVYPSGSCELSELLQAIIQSSEETTGDFSFATNDGGFKESAGYGCARLEEQSHECCKIVTSEHTGNSIFRHTDRTQLFVFCLCSCFH